MNPLADYQARLAERRAVSEQKQKQFRLIGNLRLAVGVSGVIVAFFVFGETIVAPWWLAVFLAAFVTLVVIHSKVVDSLECANRAVTFYEQGLARLENRWMGAGQTGDEYRQPSHVYEEDLDIFGKGSLFELLCTARTRAGEETLAGWLLAPVGHSEAVARQQAVQELASRLELRESMAVLGSSLRSNMDASSVATWGEAPTVEFPTGAPIIAAILAVAVLATFGAYMFGAVKRTPFLFALFFELGYGFFLGSKTLAVTAAVNSPARDLALFGNLLKYLESQHFEASLLQQMRARLMASQLVASLQIRKLQRLVSMLDWARNILFTPISMAILWAPQIAMAIERWRRIAGPHLREWLACVGEFEALFALAGYRHEHPDDQFPKLLDGPAWLEAKDLRHPLMPETQSIPNDVQLGGDLRLLIVSGSNMSGKSTLLRAVGLNTVLAWAGAPVRASSFAVSELAVAASIRVQDSLQDGRSRFYAEITRLREIVNLTNGQRPVLFLMDELLSGTNSHDRKIGAAAIVRSLVERGAIGIITTHDLALAHIADDLPGRAINVHFADTLEDGRLHFDYRLQPGIVERSNALDLMRSVGLEV